MSIFTICNMACMTRLALATSGSDSSSGNRRGTICQDKIQPRTVRVCRRRPSHLVDMARAKILPDRRDAAAKADVASPRGILGTCQRGVAAFGDKVECRAALQGDGRSRVMREDEDGNGGLSPHQPCHV
jgi:hypothetical protein